MKLLESWGASDSRWKLASDICLSNSILVKGELGDLQKAKLYCEEKLGLYELGRYIGDYELII